jgi:LPXTG-motif cell wall-anchored protein
VISKRGLFSAGALGVGTVLFATGSAFACNISDFSLVSTSASCNADTGTADIQVTDKDSSGTHATVTIVDKTTNASVGTGKITRPQRKGGETITISVPWQKNHEWAVQIDAPKGGVHDTLKETVTSNGDDCGKPSDTPTTPAPTETAPATGGDTDTKPTEAPAAPSSPAAAPSEASQVDAANSPSAAAAAPSSTVDSAALAETGGGSNTGMIAGLAAALVVIGGGFLFAQRRRSATRSH